MNDPDRACATPLAYCLIVFAILLVAGTLIYGHFH